METLLYSIEELIAFKVNFLHDIEKCKNKKESSLNWLEHKLPIKSFLKNNENFQIISFGGTNFITAEALYLDSKVKILSLKEGKVPLFDNKDHFLNFIINLINSEVKYISFAFAYPLLPSYTKDLLDGILIKSTKGNKFEGLIGKKIGEEIEKKIRNTFSKEIKVTVANDTVCACLAGINTYPKGSLISLVVGTGTNMAFFNNGSIINLESGNFDKLNRTESGNYIDLNSLDPGHHIFEKEVSGAYLYKHYNYLISKLNLNYTEFKDSQEMNQALKDSKNVSFDLATMLIERSASLVASQLAGLYEFKNKKTLNIITEGSMFWEGYRYKEFIEKYLFIFKIPKTTINFIKIDKSSLIGAEWLLFKI